MDKIDRFDMIVGMIVMVPLTILRGWVLFKLWGWFLIPLGLPTIGIAHALGISSILGLMTMTQLPDSNKGVGEILSGSISISVAWLFLGWIYTLFM